MRKYLLSAILVPVFAFTAPAQSPTPQALPLVPELNSRAVTLVKPDFPETAVVTGIDGTGLSLKVIVDPDGYVISARCFESCPAMLRGAAELAAASSTFRPLVINGKAVKYEGILAYAFVVKRVLWPQFGSYLESTRQFDNIGFGPVAQLLTEEFAEERKKLISLNGVDYVSRQKGISEVEQSIRSKLKGVDLWHFEMSMALRRITFWNVAVERIDRPALQKALDDLPRLIAKAPEEVPAKLIEGLHELAKYRVPAELGERELRQAIANLTRGIRFEQ